VNPKLPLPRSQLTPRAGAEQRGQHDQVGVAVAVAVGHALRDHAVEPAGRGERTATLVAPQQREVRDGAIAREGQQVEIAVAVEVGRPPRNAGAGRSNGFAPISSRAIVWRPASLPRSGTGRADLASVRDRPRDVPESERAAWQGLWAAVDEALATARQASR
jgi:hypothetical protein